MCKTSYEAGIRHSEKTVQKEIKNLRTALKVIYTWASFDKDQGIITEHHALNGKHVMELCERALNNE